MTIRPMQIFSSLLTIGSFVVLTGCSAGLRSSSPPIPCNVGTLVQLAGPTQGQTGISTTIGQITIVADGNNNLLYTTSNQWIVTMVDSSGQSWTGASLRLVADPSGPHPYPSDFFYASNMPTLIAGRAYTASLAQPGGSCLPVSLGSFST